MQTKTRKTRRTAKPEAETVAPEAAAPVLTPEAEAAANSAPEPVAETVAAPETTPAERRRIAVSFLDTVDPGRRSVPIKALAEFKAYRATLGVLRGKTTSHRQAAALIVACLASGNRLPESLTIAGVLATLPGDASDSDKRDALKAAAAGSAVTFPRRFTLTGEAFGIENGCTADCVSTGAVLYSETAEAFTLTGFHAAKLRAIIAASEFAAAAARFGITD